MKDKNLLLCGDYGTGKTSLLVSAAQEAAKDPGNKVFFIPVMNSFKAKLNNLAFILNQALKNKFEGTRVKVVTIEDLQKHYGGDDNHHLLRKFIKQEGAGAKVFIDELPLPQEALKNILRGTTPFWLKHSKFWNPVHLILGLHSLHFLCWTTQMNSWRRLKIHSSQMMDLQKR